MNIKFINLCTLIFIKLKCVIVTIMFVIIQGDYNELNPVQSVTIKNDA